MEGRGALTPGPSPRGRGVTLQAGLLASVHHLETIEIMAVKASSMPSGENRPGVTPVLAFPRRGGRDS